MPAFYPAFPIRVSPMGTVAGAPLDRYVRSLIEQILFTTPGERVNRPTLGCGLRNVVFAAQDESMLAAVRFMAEKGLHDALFGLISDLKVEVDSEEERLIITVRYTLTGQEGPQEARFVQ